MKIYIVEGRTGEYDDRREWAVKAFEDKQTAEDFTALCNKEAEHIDEIRKHNYKLLPEERALATADPELYMDYGGTEYTYYELELVKEA